MECKRSVCGCTNSAGGICCKAYEKGLPTFTYPEDAIKAIDKLMWYYRKTKNL